MTSQSERTRWFPRAGRRGADPSVCAARSPMGRLVPAGEATFLPDRPARHDSARHDDRMEGWRRTAGGR